MPTATVTFTANGSTAGTRRARPFDTICSAPRYLTATDVKLPHVVKFSGGRSSAAMALSLARSGALTASRGDVVLFANTTAEHAETYEFAANVCAEIEQDYEIPCFWYEFCTYETAGRNGWIRRAGYRLVRQVPISPEDSAATPGYRSDGSAFEALASLRLMLPNRSLRFCTQALKVQPGIALLAEWFSGGTGPRHLGHFHDSPQTSAAQAARRYRGNSMTPEEYEAVSSFAYSEPWARPEQRWADFTTVKLDRTLGRRPEVDLAGRTGQPFRYLTLLGLRSDEASRVTQAMFHAMMADGSTSSQCRHDSHPAGELVACPLSDHKVDRQTVDTFWDRQHYDLGIDGRWGNCVYCPLKGEPALRRLAAEEAERDDIDSGSPMSIHWWASIEHRYGRASHSEGADNFRFLSLRAPTYAELAENPSGRQRTRTQTLPCACTD